jgi:Uma2 family endonuclease
VKTVVLGPRPAELDAVIARRRALGHDGYDEVWEGDYHMAPMAHQWHGHVQFQLAAAIQPLASRAGLVSIGPFNLGAPDDFRVPDAGIHRTTPDSVFLPSAMIVIEVVSPGDESWEKFDFYAAHSVDEIVIADPADRSIAMFRRSGSTYRRVDRSEVLGVTAQELHASIAWPGSS